MRPLVFCLCSFCTLTRGNCNQLSNIKAVYYVCVCFCVLVKVTAGTCYTLLAGSYLLFQLCRDVFNSNQHTHTYTHTDMHNWKLTNYFIATHSYQKVQDPLTSEEHHIYHWLILWDSQLTVSKSPESICYCSADMQSLDQEELLK